MVIAVIIIGMYRAWLQIDSASVKFSWNFEIDIPA